MIKKIVESVIHWRGSVTDLATDCASLLTWREGHEFQCELDRFQSTLKLRDEKFQGNGHQLAVDSVYDAYQIILIWAKKHGKGVPALPKLKDENIWVTPLPGPGQCFSCPEKATIATANILLLEDQDLANSIK